MVAPITSKVPDPAATSNEQERKGLERALDYMGLKAGTPLETVAINRVSLARAPMGASRICAPPPASLTDTRSPQR